MENLDNLNKQLESFFDSKAESFNSRFLDRENTAKKMFDNGIIKVGDKVLDIACGTGVLDRLLIQNGAKQVVALDISQKMIDFAKANNSNNNVTFLHSDIYKYNGSDFDLAIIYSAYPHLLNKVALVDKLAMVLKEGGRFIVLHNSGYKKLNKMHSTLDEGIYVPLKKATEECKIFKNKFTIDLIVDKEDEYIFSGIKK